MVSAAGAVCGAVDRCRTRARYTTGRAPAGFGRPFVARPERAGCRSVGRLAVGGSFWKRKKKKLGGRSSRPAKEIHGRRRCSRPKTGKWPLPFFGSLPPDGLEPISGRASASGQRPAVPVWEGGGPLHRHHRGGDAGGTAGSRTGGPARASAGVLWPTASTEMATRAVTAAPPSPPPCRRRVHNRCGNPPHRSKQK